MRYTRGLPTRRRLGCPGTCQDARQLGALGIDPASAAALLSAAQQLFSLFSGHPQDKRRLQSNLEAFQAALNGNCEAVRYLKQRTGDFGIVPVGYAPPTDAANGAPAGTPIGGWATQVAQGDALSKYSQAAPFCGMPVQPGNPNNPPVVSEAPSAAELQTAIDRMMRNVPVGRDALRWVVLGYITAAQVAQAQAVWGQRLYQPGGALDPAQGSVVSVPPINLDGKTILMIGGAALALVVLASGSSRRR